MNSLGVKMNGWEIFYIIGCGISFYDALVTFCSHKNKDENETDFYYFLIISLFIGLLSWSFFIYNEFVIEGRRKRIAQLKEKSKSNKTFSIDI